MQVEIRIHDQTPGGPARAMGAIQVEERATLREIIAERVRAEVERLNRERPTRFNCLVQPTAAEATLNGYKVERWRRIDPEAQVEAALDAFGKQGFLVLVGDAQVEELDEPFYVPPNALVTFIRLVPLVGG